MKSQASGDFEEADQMNAYINIYCFDFSSHFIVVQMTMLTASK